MTDPTQPNGHNLNWRILPEAVQLRIGPPNTTEGPAVLLEPNQAVACFAEIILAAMGLKPSRDGVVSIVEHVDAMRPKPEPDPD